MLSISLYIELKIRRLDIQQYGIQQLKYWTKLDTEAFTTTAISFGIRIIKLKAFV